MGRVSKRKKSQPATFKEKESNYGEKRYKAGVYARLSADIEGKKESIDVQIKIAEKFVEDFNQNHREKIDIVGYYSDVGKTGSNFERDGFNRLMQEIRLGDIDCVIVKDLSRFGRNYLEAGNYIEKIFPFLGVRFIAVSDGYDTGESGNGTGQKTPAMEVEIKNLVNDMYAKDISVKAKTSLKQRRAAGSYVGGVPPYGYQASWEGKVRKLIPDEKNAGIVVHIYTLFVEKESCSAVADDLNRRRVNPPAVYARTKEVYCPPEAAYKGWERGAVERIIKSETYAGRLVQGKTTLTARDEKSRIHKPEGEWVVKENSHEPLVNMELFQKAQEIMGKIHDASMAHQHYAESYPLGEDVFGNVLYCGVCGKKLTRESQIRSYADGSKERHEGYFCSNSGQTKNDKCPQTNRIQTKDLSNILISVFRMEFALYLDKPKRFIEVGKREIDSAKLRAEKEIKAVQKRVQEMREGEADAYMDYRDGKISQREYVSFKLENEDYLRKLEKQVKELEEKKKNLEKVEGKYLSAVKSLLRLKKGENLTAELVEALVKKIYLYPGKRVEIQFRYVDEMLEGVR